MALKYPVKALILVHRRGVILGPTRAVVFLLPIAILILLVSLMRIGVHAMANVGGRYTSLDMLHVEPDQGLYSRRGDRSVGNV